MMMKRKLEAAFRSALTVSCLCGLSIASVHADVVSPPKNFIVIFADDFGYGDLGCYRELYQGGDDRSLAHEYTPNLDRLGQQGVRFMQAYTASWCAPARQNTRRTSSTSRRWRCFPRTGRAWSSWPAHRR